MSMSVQGENPLQQAVVTKDIDASRDDNTLAAVEDAHS